MEKEEKLKTTTKKPADVNGNNAQCNEAPTKRRNGIATGIKDHIRMHDGRVFYPCQFCNKVFPVKKSRALHIKKCPAKEYILSVDDTPFISNGQNTQKPDIPPPKKTPNKIDIQQNIVLNTQMNVSEILSNSKTPPIKLTIRRSTSNGTHKEHFTVSSSLVLKEKNDTFDDFLAIAKRLENNAVTIIKQPRHEPKKETKQETRGRITITKQPRQEPKKETKQETRSHITITKQPRQEPKRETKQEERISTTIIQETGPEPKNETKQETRIRTPTPEPPQKEDPQESSSESQESSSDSPDNSCRECTKEVKSPIELLRHSRKCHSYPKVVMALSEVKKFYSVKDRSACPICHKPLKTNFRSAFVKHLHTHTNEMKYSCSVCNKKFRRADHMKAHAKRHVIKGDK